MQRIVTIEKNQLLEIPAGEFTIDTVEDMRVALTATTRAGESISLNLGESYKMNAMSLTYIERYKDCAHVRIDSEQRFIASEMAIGSLNSKEKFSANTVVVVTHT